MRQKCTWNGLFLAGLLQVDKYQGAKHNNPVDGEVDGKHKHSAISWIYTLHQDIFLKYEEAKYSLVNIVSKSRSKMLHGNRTSWELFEDVLHFHCYL